MKSSATIPVLIVPGLRGHVAEHWQTLLEAKLSNVSCVPRMERDELSCARWVDALDRSLVAIGEPAILVAHSAGCMIAVHWAKRHHRAIKGALLAAPPDFESPLPAGYPAREVLRDNGWLPMPRVPLPFPSIVAASTNDPLGRFDRVSEMAAGWGSRLVDVGAVGHLNPASGFGEWPRALDFIRELGASGGCRMMRPAFAFVSGRALEWRFDFNRLWPGLLLSGVIAIASTFIADHRGGPTLLYALLIGMALNTIVGDGRAKAGVDFCARRILRIGVALLGARITFGQIGALGWFNGVMLVAAVAFTIGFGALVARRLGLSHRLGILTGGATAICGASAAIAIAAVLPRDERSERELIFTVAGVTALSTGAMVLYPVLVKMLGLDAHQAGIFLGGTIHDVAQVVGAGYSIAPEVGDFAVLTKLLRVALLLPVVTLISLAVRRRGSLSGQVTRDPLVPAFLVGFVVLVAAGSAGLIPAPAVTAFSEIARGCLVLAIAAVGLKTSPVELKKVGGRAFILLVVETVFLAALVLAAQAVHSLG